MSMSPVSNPIFSENIETFRVSSPKRRKLNRCSAASTALIGDKKTKDLSSKLTEILKNSNLPIKAMKKKHSSKPSLHNPGQAYRTASKNLRKALQMESLKPKESERLIRAIRLSEKKSNKLKLKIHRFEKLFMDLCKSLEEQEGTEEFKKISQQINNEFSKPNTKRTESHLVGRKLFRSISPGRPKALKGTISMQLAKIKNRTLQLINFLKKNKN